MYGGGIYQGRRDFGDNVEFILNNCMVADNWAGIVGGGIYHYAGGGYLVVRSISDCTVSGNNGGGIYNLGGGKWTLTNSTVSGNDGHGIWTTYGDWTLTNCTVTANVSRSSGVAGGIQREYGTFALHNTIVAENSPSDIGGFVQGTYNLIGNGSGMTGISHGINGNLVGTSSSPINPWLGPLQDNGGPTWTQALPRGWGRP